MSWVWLSTPVLDFGGARPAYEGDERVVWLHADALGALGLANGAGPDEIRRAYRRLAREAHPDAEQGSSERFAELQAAVRWAEGEHDLQVEPAAGEWWRFVGYEQPDGSAPGAVAGLVFEIHGIRRVPRSGAEQRLRVSAAGQALPLAVVYSESRFALPVRLARLAAAAESALLVGLCLLVVPVVALLLAVDVFFLSGENPALMLALGFAALAGGYGAVAAVLVAGGRPAPLPRRAIWRARSALAELRPPVRGR